MSLTARANWYKNEFGVKISRYAISKAFKVNGIKKKRLRLVRPVQSQSIKCQ
jgi:hypothetical protein